MKLFPKRNGHRCGCVIVPVFQIEFDRQQHEKSAGRWFSFQLWPQRGENKDQIPFTTNHNPHLLSTYCPVRAVVVMTFFVPNFQFNGQFRIRSNVWDVDGDLILGPHLVGPGIDHPATATSRSGQREQAFRSLLDFVGWVWDASVFDGAIGLKPKITAFSISSIRRIEIPYFINFQLVQRKLVNKSV